MTMINKNLADAKTRLAKISQYSSQVHTTGSKLSELRELIAKSRDTHKEHTENNDLISAIQIQLIEENISNLESEIDHRIKSGNKAIKKLNDIIAGVNILDEYFGNIISTPVEGKSDKLVNNTEVKVRKAIANVMQLAEILLPLYKEAVDKCYEYKKNLSELGDKVNRRLPATKVMDLQ